MEYVANDQVSSRTANTFIISCCEGSGVASLIVNKATEYLQQEDRGNSQLVAIGLSSTEVPASVYEFFVRMFRKYGLHRNERETVLGPADQLIATQLVLASQNQKDLGQFDVDVSKVLEVNSKLIHSKLSSLAENNQGSSSDFEETSFSEFINNYNSFLRHCNSVDWMDVMKSVHKETNTNLDLQNYIQRSDFLVLNPRDDLVERNLVCELAKGKECAVLSMSLSLNESFSPEMTPHSAELSVEKCSMDEALSCVSSVATSSLSTSEEFTTEVTIIKPDSSTEENCCTTVIAKKLNYYFKFVACMSTSYNRKLTHHLRIYLLSQVFAVHIFLAYLELLVNSRNELALARVINIPDRKLDHSAFTDIKHEAKKRNLSMYQTIISFTTRLRLGGKSYAPTKDCPLVQHSEGLGKFTDFVDKLQIIIEEDTVAESAVKRVVNVIKANIRGSSSQLKMSAVEKVASHLLDQATVIMNPKCLETNASPTHNASDGGALVGRRTLRIIRTLLDHFASLPSALQSIDVLTDAFAASQKTPVRFPSLMSKFRSPEECDEPSLFERLTKRIAMNESKPRMKLSVRPQSGFNWASSDAMSSDYHILSTGDHVSSLSVKHSEHASLEVALWDYYGEQYQCKSGILELYGFKETVNEVIKMCDASRKPNCTKRLLESSKDQENEMQQLEQQSDGKKLTVSGGGNTSSIRATLQPMNSNTKDTTSKRKGEMQPSIAKKSKVLTKPKAIPQVKGQQKLGSFFRV